MGARRGRRLPDVAAQLAAGMQQATREVDAAYPVANTARAGQPMMWRRGSATHTTLGGPQRLGRALGEAFGVPPRPHPPSRRVRAERPPGVRFAARSSQPGARRRAAGARAKNNGNEADFCEFLLGTPRWVGAWRGTRETCRARRTRSSSTSGAAQGSSGSAQGRQSTGRPNGTCREQPSGPLFGRGVVAAGLLWALWARDDHAGVSNIDTGKQRPDAASNELDRVIPANPSWASVDHKALVPADWWAAYEAENQRRAQEPQ